MQLWILVKLILLLYNGLVADRGIIFLPLFSHHQE
jgi:hypothetical protein